jgi:SWIM zinc finger
MSWTTVRGHWPVGVLYREREIGNQNSELGDVKQRCSCGESYTCEHIAALVTD